MRTIGIDYGDARTGFAITDALNITAQGLKTIVSDGNDCIILSIKSQTGGRTTAVTFFLSIK